MKQHWYLFLIIGLLGCNPPAQPIDATMKGDSIAAASKPEVAAIPIVPAIPDNYAILHNIEMIEFCLPYPKYDFQEDAQLSEGKAHHVFVSGDKKSRMILHGNLMDMTFDQLFELSVKDIQSITGGDPIMQNKNANSFELKWKQAGNLIHVKKWFRQTENVTITARFEYPEANESSLKEAMAIIIGQTTLCEQH